MKITEYNGVTAPTPHALGEVVNRMIQYGWQPHGGVAVAVIPGGDGRFTYAQAMVKSEEAAKPASTGQQTPAPPTATPKQHRTQNRGPR